MARAAAKKPAVDLDLFGLGECKSLRAGRTPLLHPAETPKPKPVVAAATPKPPTISAAPAVADFTPPPPTASDPYPGYYQLPSGAWAAYDAAYYTSFFDDGSSALAAAEAKKENRVGRAWAELDEGRADVVEYDVSTGLAEGKAARELEAARLASKPKLTDDYTYTDVGQTRGLAAERHQLTSLLSSAFSQREELEARIAQNKKNMRNAGNKYGAFSHRGCRAPADMSPRFLERASKCIDWCASVTMYSIASSAPSSLKAIRRSVDHYSILVLD
jgi:hypothetical protein